MELLRQLFLWTSQNSNSLYSVPRPRTPNRAEILGEDLIYVRNSTITDYFQTYEEVRSRVFVFLVKFTVQLNMQVIKDTSR